MSTHEAVLGASASAPLERYYRWHAPIYDLTRWTFLFGRSTLRRWLVKGSTPNHVIEVGCGTGRNLTALARWFPTSQLTGVDLSGAMLARAERRLRPFGARARCLQRPFDARLRLDPPGDLLLFSYTLSMMNPGWEQALEVATAQLPPGGRIAVVDFAGTPWPCFRRWMAWNHVRLDDHLLPRLRALFRSDAIEVCRAFGGAWRYFLYLGTRAHA